MNAPARACAVVALAVTSAVAAQPSPRTPAALRFHHLHVRVGDPGSALDESAGRSNGTKTLLGGHGMSVRVGGEYVVLDREDPDVLAAGDSRVYAQLLQASGAYLHAREWLTTRGASVAPAALTDTSVAAAIPAARVDAIAFSAQDVAAAVAVLTAAGATPLSQSDDTVRFRLTPELIVEVVAETGAPDAFWCPMHPSVRSPRASRCPLCGMALVAIPPPRTGQYAMDVTPRLRRDGRSLSGLRIGIREPESNQPVRSFVDVHERPLHLFVVSQDLERFEHVHPRQRADGTFEVDAAIEAGAYVLVAEFLPAGGTPQTVHHALVTPGYTGPLFTTAHPGPPVLERVVDGVRIRLDAPRIAALERTELRFALADDRTGAPIADLEPYLGAAGHLIVVNPELTTALHGHPEGELTRGPVVTFDPELPAEGPYKLWVQFQRGGRVITASFVIEAREAR